MQIQANTMEQATDAVPQGWSARFRMPLFHPGARVWHADKWETVDYVKLRRQELSVFLVGHGEPVSTRELALAPTMFTTTRVALAQSLGYDADF